MDMKSWWRGKIKQRDFTKFSYMMVYVTNDLNSGLLFIKMRLFPNSFYSFYYKMKKDSSVHFSYYKSLFLCHQTKNRWKDT